MKTLRWINSFAMLMLLPLFFSAGPTVAADTKAPDVPQARTTPLIIDHNTSVDITAIPQNGSRRPGACCISRMGTPRTAARSPTG